MPRSTPATPAGRCSTPAPAWSESTSRSRPAPAPTTASGSRCPISAVKRSIAQLREDGEAEYAYIGVSSQPLYPQLARKLGLDTTFGGLVSEVVSGGPAEEAGIKGGNDKVTLPGGRYRTGGDVIVQVDGQQIVGPDDLAECGRRAPARRRR